MPPEAEVKKVCPWYFQMKQIIGEHPNVRPVGLRNSASVLDLDALMPSSQDETSKMDDNKTPPLGNNLGNNQRCTEKRSVSTAGLNEDVKPKVGTPVHPNMSKPTAKRSKPKKAKVEDLTEIAVTEESTHQKELDLNIQRSKEKEAKAQAKVELCKAELEAKVEKAQMTHDIEMMKLQLELANAQQTAPGAEMGISMQTNQDNLHVPSLYCPYSSGFGFGDGGQIGSGAGRGSVRTTSAEGSSGEGLRRDAQNTSQAMAKE